MADIYLRPFWETAWWNVGEEAQQKLQLAIKEAASGRFVRYEASIWGSGSGSELITIDFSLKPVFDEDSSMKYILVEGRNITEKKKAEEELVRKNAELRQLCVPDTCPIRLTDSPLPLHLATSESAIWTTCERSSLPMSLTSCAHH